MKSISADGAPALHQLLSALQTIGDGTHDQRRAIGCIAGNQHILLVWKAERDSHFTGTTSAPVT